VPADTAANSAESCLLGCSLEAGPTPCHGPLPLSPVHFSCACTEGVTRTDNDKINEAGVRNWCKLEGRVRMVGTLFSDPVEV